MLLIWENKWVNVHTESKSTFLWAIVCWVKKVELGDAEVTSWRWGDEVGFSIGNTATRKIHVSVDLLQNQVLCK
jgi:hypothetical protein